jgi:hypothetical protein
LCRFGQVSLRIRFEFFDTTGAAKIVFLSRMLVDVLRRRGVHVHPADWIAVEDGGDVRGLGHFRWINLGGSGNAIRIPHPTLIADALY